MLIFIYILQVISICSSSFMFMNHILYILFIVLNFPSIFCNHLTYSELPWVWSLSQKPWVHDASLNLTLYFPLDCGGKLEPQKATPQ